MEFAGKLTCILSVLKLWHELHCERLYIWCLPSDGCDLLSGIRNNLRNGFSSGFVIKVVYLLPEVAIFHLTA